MPPCPCSLFIIIITCRDRNVFDIIMLMKQLICTLFLLLPLSGATAQDTPPAEGEIIRSLTIKTKRVETSAVLDKLPLHEGGRWSAAAQRDTLDILHSMRIFRTVSLSSRHDEKLDGAVVDITADDGWFVLPLPFLSGGSGRKEEGITLMESNGLRGGEAFYGAFISGENGQAAGMGMSWGKWSLSLSGSHLQYDETSYADGAFLAGKLAGSPSNLPDYTVPVSAAYKTLADTVDTKAVYRPDAHYSYALGFESRAQGYKALTGPTPTDGGRQNVLSAQMRYHSAVGSGANIASSFGVMFGLGLSDREEKLLPLPAVKYEWDADGGIAAAGGFTGSDYDFSTVSAGVLLSAETKNRHLALLRVRAAKGFGLPFAQLIATGRELGLSGSYARDFRGDSGAGASSSFTYFLRRSRLGLLAVAPFAEYARIWSGGLPYGRAGAGLNFYYRFWRFPLPLGFGWTHSFSDNSNTASMSAGFSFGE